MRNTYLIWFCRTSNYSQSVNMLKYTLAYAKVTCSKILSTSTSTQLSTSSRVSLEPLGAVESIYISISKYIIKLHINLIGFSCIPSVPWTVSYPEMSTFWISVSWLRWWCGINFKAQQMKTKAILPRRTRIRRAWTGPRPRMGARRGPGTRARTRVISSGAPASTWTSTTPVSSAVNHIISILVHQRRKKSKAPFAEITNFANSFH